MGPVGYLTWQVLIFCSVFDLSWVVKSVDSPCKLNAYIMSCYSVQYNTCKTTPLEIISKSYLWPFFHIQETQLYVDEVTWRLAFFLHVTEKSPHLHLHTPPNPTGSRWYDHEWLKADYKPDSSIHLISASIKCTVMGEIQTPLPMYHFGN